MSENAPCPELLFCGVSRAQLLQLLGEIASEAENVEVRVRDGQSDRVVRLNALVSLIDDGEICTAQVRYRCADSLWIDTITLTAEGARIVRIEHPAHSHFGA